MRHKGKIAGILAVVFGTTLIHATLIIAQQPMPTPVLALLGQEPFQSGGKQFIRYRYFVANAQSFPDALFAQAPNLPPCGANTKASRTWVDFFDNAGKRLNGFCALGKNEDLNGIWFALDAAVIPPSYVHIEMTDRQTNTKVKSNDAGTTLSTAPRVAATSPTMPLPSFGRYYALVIGNQAYQHLPRLKTPAVDARAVADLLQREYGFDNVRLLTDATRAVMVRGLEDFRRRLIESDNVVIYYAGHGWLDKDADRGYWLPIDAENDSHTNWLSNADITDNLRAMRAKHVLVVADSCYSGTLSRNINVQPLTPADLARLAQKRARMVLTSGSQEPVSDVGGGAHSVFARAFLDSLRGNSGVIDMTSLFTEIRRRVMVNADQTPQYSYVRQAGHEDGDFIFVRRR